MEPRSVRTRPPRSQSLPRRVYEEAKDAGNWNPSRLDFSADRIDWEQLDGEMRPPVLAVAVMCCHGQQIQLHNLNKIMMALEHRSTLDESLCLSSLVFDAARNLEFYGILFEDIIPLVGDPDRFLKPRYRQIIGERLPALVEGLDESSSATTLLEALTFSGPLCRGVLGLTGLYVFESTLVQFDIMPTTRLALQQQRRGFLRHNEFTTYLIGKLLRQSPSLWSVVDEVLQSSFEPAIGLVREFFDSFSKTVVSRAEAVTYAVEQFSLRYEQLELTRDPNRSVGLSRRPRSGIC
ncbi:MAG: hypothetical protein ACOC9W_01360 [Persicimonas sp.]